ncbi:MAG: glycosyltransferase family 4 protein [Deferribacterales bacterium]
MRIAFAQRKILGRNGASRIIAEQMRVFRQSGHDVYLYSARCNSDVIGEGINIKTFFSIIPGKEKRRRAYAEGYEKFCRKNRIDIAFGNGDTFFQDVLFMHNMLEAENCIVKGDNSFFKSSVFHIHNRILSEQNYKVLICNSMMMRDYFVEKYNLDRNRVRVLYPGYDKAIFNTADVRQASDLIRERHAIDRKYMLGFVSSGNLLKRGVDILIDAMGFLDRELSKYSSLLLIGKDGKIEDYKRRIAEVNPEIQVIAVGAVDDIANYYKSIDILLHPAHIEEFGMTLLEAAACGVPVITSKMTGFSEILRGDERKYVMERPDASVLAELTSGLLEDSHARAVTGASSAINAINYSWEGYIANLYEILEDFSLMPSR